MAPRRPRESSLQAWRSAASALVCCAPTAISMRPSPSSRLATISSRRTTWIFSAPIRCLVGGTTISHSAVCAQSTQPCGTCDADIRSGTESTPAPMPTVALARAKALSAAQNRAIGMIASGVGLPEVLDELCRAIDVLTPGVVSTVLQMDPDGTRLWPGGGPAFPAALKPAINPWMIGPGRGACGTAAFLKQRVIIADVSTDPRWPDEYRALALSHGLRASWSQPLMTNAGNVLVTFAMYYAEPRKPEAADLELIEAAGQ